MGWSWTRVKQREAFFKDSNWIDEPKWRGFVLHSKLKRASSSRSSAPAAQCAH